MTIAFARNQFTIQTDRYAAILVSDRYVSSYDYWVFPATYFGASPSWTHYFNNRQLKTKWYFRAQGEDLIEVVQDPNCVSIVLIGHGTYHSWDATDRTITNLDVEFYSKSMEKKGGEWFQLTCATDEGFKCRLGELIIPSENVYSYHSKVNSCGMILDAFSAFQYIKSQN